MKMLAICLLLLYLGVMYLACFIEPGIEKTWERQELALNQIEIFFIEGSRFLQAYGIYIGVVVLAYLAYTFFTSDQADQPE